MLLAIYVIFLREIGRVQCTMNILSALSTEKQQGIGGYSVEFTLMCL